MNEQISQLVEHKSFFKDFFSYNFAQFAIELQSAAFGIYFFFFETEVLLPVLFITIANIIYAIWNSINDPLMGYLTDRPTRFTKKWGKRFPWMVFSLPLVYISYIFLFSPPDVDISTNAGILITFLWLLIILCIADTLYSMFQLNVDGMFPDKFRTDKNRRKAAGFGTILGMVGGIIGGILPPLLYNFGDKQSYAYMAMIITIIGLVSWIICMPGLREDEEMIQRYLHNYQKEEQLPFFKTMKIALKQRNFIIFIIISFIYLFFGFLVGISLPYFTKYVLGLEADAQMLFIIGHYLGFLISIPLWMKFANKYGFGKTYVIGALLTSVLLVPGMWISDTISTFIVFTLVGVGRAGLIVMLMPIFSEVMDELGVKFGKRQEGVYMGIRTFFGRLTIIAGTLTVAIIHTLTNFVADAPIGTDTQTPLALFGIRMHFVLISLISCFLGALIFWKFYDIKGEKRERIKMKLKEMGI